MMIVFNHSKKVDKDSLMRNGIKSYKLCGESGGADVETAARFVIELKNLLLQENLTDTQVYNMDETGLEWRKMSKTTLSTMYERQNKKMEKKAVKTESLFVAHQIWTALIGKS
ncbi:hypothetical protein A3Q56_02017 [Intoshia linei]|uniref:DDE-1 domain-containing protein n=1 Tax=Intoshia linei TaxID=1819745 RepID=A0A177B993_9BILA|nr:hypothetical protein A3Q56_02017 [Intoshia linei]